MLARTDYDERDGIPVTSLARTLLDLAPILTQRRLIQAIDRAERQELFDLNAIEEVLIRAPSRKGAGALRRAIAAYKPRNTRKEFEYRFLDLIETSSLPSPNTNVLVHGATDVHEVDAFWPAHNLVVELDSFAFHRTRLDHERDANKTSDLELAGHRVVRLAWSDVTVRARQTLRRLHGLVSDT